MFPATVAREGLVVLNKRVRFFAFDLPFEPPFLTMVLVVGRLLAVLFLGGIVVLEVVGVVSVPVLVVVDAVVLPEVAPGLEVVRNKGGLVAIGWRTVENVVAASPTRFSTSASAAFVMLGVEVTNSSRSSFMPSSGIRVT
jgi:hypothetical protein